MAHGPRKNLLDFVDDVRIRVRVGVGVRLSPDRTVTVGRGMLSTECLSSYSVFLILYSPEQHRNG